MGRVGWSAGALQHSLPVNYAMHVGKVVFRTSPFGDLAHLAHPTNVAFEIDRSTRQPAQGWSVVIQGRALAVVLPQQLLALWSRSDIVPRAPGTGHPQRLHLHRPADHQRSHRPGPVLELRGTMLDTCARASSRSAIVVGAPRGQRAAATEAGSRPGEPAHEERGLGATRCATACTLSSPVHPPYEEALA